MLFFKAVCEFSTLYCFTERPQFTSNQVLAIFEILIEFILSQVLVFSMLQIILVFHIRRGNRDNLGIIFLSFALNIQSTLVISTSVISNNRLSRRENLVLVLTQKSKIRLQYFQNIFLSKGVKLHSPL